jgi:chromosome partitioning protein
MRRIAIINQKGGVGKTTTTVNLGAALALQGRRVLVIDMDAQANLSLALNVEAQSNTPTSYTVLIGETPISAAVRPTAVPNLFLVPSNIDLSGAELELASAIGREFLMRDALKTWADAERAKSGRAPVDYVLFDCPPSLGLLSINALAAASEVLITLQTEFLALQGMSKLVGVVQLLKKRLNPELQICGILPCLYDSRLKLAREVLGEIRRYFPGQVLPNPIRANVKLAEAPSYGKTIFEYAPGSHGTKDYLLAARELLAQETRHPELAGLPPFTLEIPSLAGPEEIKPAPRRVPPPRKPRSESAAAKPVTAPQEKAVAPAAADNPAPVPNPARATSLAHSITPSPSATPSQSAIPPQSANPSLAARLAPATASDAELPPLPPEALEYMLPDGGVS